jgi:hypothetical protein
METIWKQNNRASEAEHKPKPEAPFLFSKTIATGDPGIPVPAVVMRGAFIIRDLTEVSLWHANTLLLPQECWLLSALVGLSTREKRSLLLSYIAAKNSCVSF